MNEAVQHHIRRLRDLRVETILALLDRAQELASSTVWPRLDRKIVLLAFFQPSTRTLAGFEAATYRLGGAAVRFSETKREKGMSRGESLEDTVRVLSAYSDAIVLRHGDAAAIDVAVGVSSVPVINAGNGADEHPTQALVDLFAIRKHHGRLDGLRVGLVGDLKGSRAAHSLVAALGHFRCRELRLMAPRGRSLPQGCRATASTVTSIHSLDVRHLDVLYVAGLPEGVGRNRIPRSTRSRFWVTERSLRGLPEGAAVLCPMPRIDEIDTAVDQMTNASFFGQSADGLFVRAAILDWAISSRG